MEKSSSNNDDDLQHSQNLEKDDGACNNFGMFEIEEGNGFGDDDDGDGFGLLTQALTQNNVNVKNAAHSSSDESSDESSSGSSSSDESDSDSSIEGVNDGTPIQERRARNMRRNKAFVDNLKLELNAMMNNGRVNDKDDKQTHKSAKRKKIKEVEEDDNMPITSENNVAEINKRKRRGMLFSTTVPNKPSPPIQPPTQPLLTTKSLTDELNPKYPHRSNQIQVLCSQLVSIVQQSKFAWQMKNNLRSMGSSQYSEASYQGDIKMATPSPIMITGAGGNGKTCIVLDAMKALQRRTNGDGNNVHPTVANAYIDCASSESGSVGAVMNNAYRQLYESYHFNNGFGRYDKVEVNRKAFKTKEKWKYTSSSSSGIARSNLDGGNDFQDDIESDGAADDESMGEDQLERQRSRAQKLETNRRNGKKVKNVSKSKKKATMNNTNQNNVRQTRLRASLDSTKTDKQQQQSVGLGGSIPSTAASKSAQNSGSVALFGRATSALIQAGNTTRKRSSDNWRCAFLILDNADRILSWHTKNGSINPLTQIFLLPSVMGINLTFIFISRSTIFPYSAVHNPPGTLLDAIHPQSIHFHSYSSVESIKSILHVPHIQQSIIGKTTSSTSHMFHCNIAYKLRSKLNDWLYASMMNSFIPSVISSTHDITEIMRLARLLWPEYTAPLDKNSNYDDPALVSLMWQVVGGLYREDESLDDPCTDCSFCQQLSTGVDETSVENLNTQKQRLSEKLDRNIRESMRKLLSNTVMMPGRVLMKETQHPYAGRLPYITKFLLLAAFLCQNKRSEQDANLYTRQNTGKSKRRRANKPGDETAYAASSKDMTQRQPSFPLERMLSVFYSIIDQYGQNHYMTYKEEGASVAAQLGTERLFRNISQLIATGLLSTTGSAKFNERYNQNLMDKTDAKFSCNISRGDARVIATRVGFPLEKYCP